MLSLASPAASGFAPLRGPALLLTELSTVGFDARAYRAKMQKLSAPLRAAARTADRLAATVCMSDTARKALWKPGAVAPSYLDGTLAGDAGFDPLTLTALASKNLPNLLTGGWPSQSQRELIMARMTPTERRAAVAKMREAEIRHARLAMLAAAGWPLSELLQGGRAPSVLNGGLGDGPVPFFLVLAAGAAAYVEYLSEEAANQASGLGPAAPRLAGDFGFDPLGVMAEERAYRRKELSANELFNGRLAMLAITGFAAQEFLWGTPVVEQTPFFFGR